MVVVKAVFKNKVLNVNLRNTKVIVSEDTIKAGCLKIKFIDLGSTVIR